eukprot:GFUD01127077.1.p1 GENE.GFUD01127077.1~~GFUD01127077.1.p1  ORF type:complete len:107 (+),score=11.91 GFUD01127077.1:72-392(+)
MYEFPTCMARNVWTSTDALNLPRVGFRNCCYFLYRCTQVCWQDDQLLSAMANNSILRLQQHQEDSPPLFSLSAKECVWTALEPLLASAAGSRCLPCKSGSVPPVEE